MWDPNFINNINAASFYIGLKNLQENLTQSDKDDLIHSISNTNKELLNRLESDLEEQNAMLREILRRLDRIERRSYYG